MISFLRLERLKRGLRQQDLWFETGIPQWRISLIENGMRPRPDEREKLSEFLGIPEEKIDERIGVE
jgi:transcriptional regulator with XRE-family HTH domain